MKPPIYHSLEVLHITSGRKISLPQFNEKCQILLIKARQGTQMGQKDPTPFAFVLKFGEAPPLLCSHIDLTRLVSTALSNITKH